jgi:hypothetical protein
MPGERARSKDRDRVAVCDDDWLALRSRWQDCSRREQWGVLSLLSFRDSGAATKRARRDLMSGRLGDVVVSYGKLPSGTDPISSQEWQGFSLLGAILP